MTKKPDIKITQQEYADLSKKIGRVREWMLDRPNRFILAFIHHLNTAYQYEERLRIYEKSLSRPKQTEKDSEQTV